MLFDFKQIQFSKSEEESEKNRNRFKGSILQRVQGLSWLGKAGIVELRIVSTENLELQNRNANVRINSI